MLNSAGQSEFSIYSFARGVNWTCYVLQVRLKANLSVILRLEYVILSRPLSWGSILATSECFRTNRSQSTSWRLQFNLFFAGAHNAELWKVWLGFSKHAIFFSPNISSGYHLLKHLRIFSMFCVVIVIDNGLRIYQLFGHYQIETGDILVLAKAFLHVQRTNFVINSRQTEYWGT